MLSSLTNPSLHAIRASLIQEKLQKYPVKDIPLVRVIATGRTGSGKSTLGNHLVGIEYFLKSDGYTNCTDQINIVQFSLGLEYIDTPGISSDEKFENYNRVALDIAQVDGWPTVHTLTIVTYDCQRQVLEQKYPVDQIPYEQLRPDVIFYLIAPHQQLLRSDIVYMTDLLRCYGEKRIIFVYNLFTDKYTADTVITTSQNISDANTKIMQAYEQAGLDPASGKTVEINCWTGQGIADLIEVACTTLGGKQGELFAEIMLYQQKRAPDLYLMQIKKEVLRYLADVAYEKPDLDPQKQNPLCMHIQNLTDFFSQVFGQTLSLTNTEHTSIDQLVNKLSESLKREITQPILTQRSREIYSQEPVYKTIEEIDYDNPLYTEKPEYTTEYYWREPEFSEVFEATGHMVNGDGFLVRRTRTKVTYHRVQIGYGQKTRDVLDHYERVYSHTEHWTEHTGNRVVDVVYEPFGASGTALLLATIHILIQHPKMQDRANMFESTYQEKLEKLQAIFNDFKNSKKDDLTSLLVEHAKDLFDKSFDKCFQEVFGI